MRLARADQAAADQAALQRGEHRHYGFGDILLVQLRTTDPPEREATGDAGAGCVRVLRREHGAGGDHRRSYRKEIAVESLARMLLLVLSVLSVRRGACRHPGLHGPDDSLGRIPDHLHDSVLDSSRL